MYREGARERRRENEGEREEQRGMCVRAHNQAHTHKRT